MELKVEYFEGFEIKVMENPLMPKGTAVFLLHPDDYKVIFKKVQDDEREKNKGNISDH